VAGGTDSQTVEVTVCQKNVANALNSVVIILKNKVLFVTIPLFFMVELQNFLKLSIVMALSTTFTQYAPEITKFGKKITQNKGHFDLLSWPSG